MLPTFQLQKIIDLALGEDLGSGDLSSRILPKRLKGQAELYAKATGVVAGIDIVAQVFKRVDSQISTEILISDGTKVVPGTLVMQLRGPLSSILSGERTALNFLQHLSGIATATRKAVKQVEGLPVKITDTRKTLGGWRALQKYAVRIGGGYNHRFGLYDAVMLKDNHLTAMGGLTAAVEAAYKQLGHMVKLEVECESMAQVQEALDHGVEVIMLDNMTTEQMQQAVSLINHRAIVEASGGMKTGRLREVAETGVDVISIGALTHSVKALDFSLDVGEIKFTTRRRLESGENDGS
ncbi:MAG: carboxylating nicotinate-nucleotide diphosphorylase [Desulfitobacteriaceae bacterium]|nr:carboxylating nicotinate-nucleotide diphosphorylase [Desulfitobacteriaceae bacterium]MDD4401324.1 carboxylating nicotinate-nucleotide diphosphorylase [Desulfitobacteriaceae bacterium]